MTDHETSHDGRTHNTPTARDNGTATRDETITAVDDENTTADDETITAVDDENTTADDETITPVDDETTTADGGSDVARRADSAGPSAPLDDTDPSTQTDDETESAECPHCGSTNTQRDHPQGPSACRSMHSCLDCGQPFQKFG